MILLMLLTAFAAFAASPGDIVVNEIMYNGPESGTDNEWFELYNNTYGPIELDSNWSAIDGEGAYIFDGVIIGGGEYLTVKVNENGTEPFPFTPDIDASGFGIAFGNSSDDVIIFEGMIIIDSVSYLDDWGADGDGPSLERIDPLGPSTSSSNWAPSIPDGGTPGAENSIHGGDVDFPPVVEDIIHTPEYPLPTDEVTITATITDDGTITKALLFYSIDGGEEDSTTFADDGAHGDGSADDDTWGGFIPAQAAGTTVHYFLLAEDDSLNSDTSWTYAYMVTSGDTVDGDVVINEIMYNPAYPHIDAYYEFIELYNRSDSTIFVSGWILKDNSDYNTFAFPMGGVGIPAGGFVVVGKDVDTLQDYYGITGVIGPMSFGLNNSSGDAVRLFDDSGTLVDFVYFSGDDPWPSTPNGDGPSLELIDPTYDNSLASSWQASASDGTPGFSNSTGIGESFEKPTDLALIEVFPNPFNAVATISVNLPRQSETEVTVYTPDGRFAGEVFSGVLTRGTHEFALDMLNYSSGLYLIKMECGKETLFKKALLVK